MAAMSVEMRTFAPRIHCKRLSPTTALRQAYPILALDLSYFDPFEATVLFRHIFKEARRSSVSLLLSSSGPCTVLDISDPLRSASQCINPFSPLCGIWKLGVGKRKRSSFWKTKKSMYNITKARILLGTAEIDVEQNVSVLFIFAASESIRNTRVFCRDKRMCSQDLRTCIASA